MLESPQLLAAAGGELEEGALRRLVLSNGAVLSMADVEPLVGRDWLDAVCTFARGLQRLALDAPAFACLNVLALITGAPPPLRARPLCVHSVLYLRTHAVQVHSCGCDYISCEL